MPTLATFVRWFDALMSALCSVFAVTFGILTLMVCLDIVFRQFAIASMPWLVELIEYVMYGGTFLAAPWVLLTRGRRPKCCQKSTLNLSPAD